MGKNVPRKHNRIAFDSLSVEQGAGLGVGVGDDPAIFSAHQHSVISADGIVRQDNVTAFAAADGIFPIEHRNGNSTGYVFQKNHRFLFPTPPLEGEKASYQDGNAKSWN